jgi:hypothetical protein
MTRNFGILKKEQDKQRKGFNPEAPMDDGRDNWPFQESPDPEPDDRAFWKIGSSIVLIVGFAFIAMAFILFSCSARAHMRDAPELDKWFGDLASSNGAPCCSYADASTVVDADWDTTVIDGKQHYRVRLDGRWVVVTDEEVVLAPNLYKRTVVWVYKDALGITMVRCFMPGAST